MKNSVINKIELFQTKQMLSEQLAKYVEIIKMEYKGIIPDDILKYLESIEDFKDIIRIEQTGTISMFVNNGIMYFPINAYEILNMMKKSPGFGVNKNHKIYTRETIILNDNTYIDYLKHVFIVGLTPLQFFMETLLHETTHLCGMGGAGALREGFAELKTRELATKYNLLTSACGYPKEVKIAATLQNIFGKEIVDRIAFAKSNNEILQILTSTFDESSAKFYESVSIEMEKNFELYYGKSYPGIIGPLQKTREYSKINYDKIYQLITDYSNNIDNKRHM